MTAQGRSNGIWNADPITSLARNVGTGEDKKLLRLADRWLLSPISNGSKEWKNRYHFLILFFISLFFYFNFDVCSYFHLISCLGSLPNLPSSGSPPPCPLKPRDIIQSQRTGRGKNGRTNPRTHEQIPLAKSLCPGSCIAASNWRRNGLSCWVGVNPRNLEVLEQNMFDCHSARFPAISIYLFLPIFVVFLCFLSHWRCSKPWGMAYF